MDEGGLALEFGLEDCFLDPLFVELLTGDDDVDVLRTGSFRLRLVRLVDGVPTVIFLLEKAL